MDQNKELAMSKDLRFGGAQKQQLDYSTETGNYVIGSCLEKHIAIKSRLPGQKAIRQKLILFKSKVSNVVRPPSRPYFGQHAQSFPQILYVKGNTQAILLQQQIL